MTVSRILPPKEYALLMAFLGLLTILGRPLLTLATSINHFVSLMVQSQSEGSIRRLIKKWTMLSGVPGILLGVLLVVGSTAIAHYFHLERRAPVVVTGLIVPALFVMAVFNGAAMGLQRFNWVAAGIIGGALGRLILGTIFVYWVYPASGWALLGHGMGAYITLGLLSVGVLKITKPLGRTQDALPSMRTYLLHSLFIQLAYVFLMTADIIMVKHYFPANDVFAYAATIGRMVAFLPASIALAMFPKVTSSGDSSPEHHRMFIRAFGYTLICVALALAACVILPQVPLWILFGIRTPSPELLVLTRLMSLAMSFSALLNVVAMYLLAQRRFSAASITIIFAVLYMVSVHLMHASALQVAWQAVIFNALCLILCSIAAFRNKHREGC